MGGRGQATEGLNPATGMNGTFYDLTDVYGGMKLRDFEKTIKDKKQEYIGLADKNGNIIIAGTSGLEGEVVVPTSHPEFKNVKGITHNHPNEGNRMIGGTFSGADVINTVALNLDYTRAVAKGQNENTYIIRKKAGAKQDQARMHSYATRAGARKNVEKIYNSAVNKVNSKLASQGKPKLSPRKESQVGLGALKRRWKNDIVSKYGYEYIENKKSW